MVIKIYALTWLVLLAAGCFLHFTGNFNEVTLMLFGFVLTTLVFTGLVAVLPWWVDKNYSWNY